MTPGGTRLPSDTIIRVAKTKESQPRNSVSEVRLDSPTRGVISVQSAKMAIWLSLAVATALGSWYLSVRIPESQWRRPHEAGQASMSRGQFGEAEREFATAVELAKALGENDPREALSLFHQADALVAQNRFDDAIPLFELPWRSTRRPSGQITRMSPPCSNIMPCPSAAWAGPPRPRPPRTASGSSATDPPTERNGVGIESGESKACLEETRPRAANSTAERIFRLDSRV